MAIQVGDKAPDFELKDNHGRAVKLSDFRGSKNVVLLFYPFAFTGVCTGELCEVRDNLPKFADRDTQVLAVSNDSIHTLRVFAEQEGCAVRGTFVIDKEGLVRWTVVNALPDARDLGEYVAALDTL
jgi:peroxiredoxin